jgi:homoserine O-acetyltransferase
MVNPVSATEFAKNCQTGYLELTGDCGHMATVCEMDKLASTAKAFLFSGN